MAENRKKQGQKKKKTSFFFRSLHRDGPGVSKKDAVITYGFKGFFSLYFRRFGTLFSVNLLYVFGNLPLLAALYAISGNIFSTETRMHHSLLYPSLRAVFAGDVNPVTAALNGVLGTRGVDYVLHLPARIMFGVCIALFVVVTFGLVNVGCAYIQRNLIKGEPVFLFSDFWYAIKRNFKQAIPMGIIDLLIWFLLYQDILFWYYNAGSFWRNYLFYASILIAVFWFIVRFYLYEMMVTFKLSLFKLIKNSAILAFVGLKRNLIALIGILAFCLFCYGIFYTYVPIGVILPFTIMISTCTFMAIFAAWPNIKKTMIDPYYPQEQDSAADTVQEEPVFRDDVTQREREEAWKNEHLHK